MNHMGQGETRFPGDFEFGVASNAYQIEGAAAVDGKGPSIWDVFSHQHKTMVDGSSGDIGPDHYHHLDEDLDLLKALGVDAYRFSISWPRVQPLGQGELNPAGLDFYERLIDGLLARGISPTASLYDWDLPNALQVPGNGWVNRDTVARYAEYVQAVAGRFVDRVDKWIPVYSPNVQALIGYAIGDHAPGRILGMEGFVAGHHLNLAHGRGVSILRALGAKQVGSDQNHQLAYAASPEEPDVAMAEFVNVLWNGFNVEPMLSGNYPEMMLPLVESALRDGDLAEIQQPLDFFGVGYYGPMNVAAAPRGSEVPFEARPFPGVPQTTLGGGVYPQGMTDMLLYFHEKYPDLPPQYVTENGFPGGSSPQAGSKTSDPERIHFLAEHLRAVRAAIDAGADVRGYYADSFLDGCYWERGLSSRFGLVQVDFDTLSRRPRDSFAWYAEVIKARAL